MSAPRLMRLDITVLVQQVPQAPVLTYGCVLLQRLVWDSVPNRSLSNHHLQSGDLHLPVHWRDHQVWDHLQPHLHQHPQR